MKFTSFLGSNISLVGDILSFRDYEDDKCVVVKLVDPDALKLIKEGLEKERDVVEPQILGKLTDAQQNRLNAKLQSIRDKAGALQIQMDDLIDSCPKSDDLEQIDENLVEFFNSIIRFHSQIKCGDRKWLQ